MDICITSLLLFIFHHKTVSVPLTGCDFVLGQLCYWQPTTKLLNNFDAQMVCAADNGRLPIFSTANDYNNFLQYKNATTSIRNETIWLGYWNYNAHSASTPGIWRDKNGTGQSGYYTYWGLTQPDDSVGFGYERCTDLEPAVVNMNDCNCGRNLTVVCQGETTNTTSTTNTAVTTQSTTSTPISSSASQVPTKTTTVAYLKGTTIPQQSAKLTELLPVVVAILTTSAILLCVCCVTTAVLYKRKWHENPKTKSVGNQTC